MAARSRQSFFRLYAASDVACWLVSKTFVFFLLSCTEPLHILPLLCLCADNAQLPSFGSIRTKVPWRRPIRKRPSPDSHLADISAQVMSLFYCMKHEEPHLFCVNDFFFCLDQQGAATR